MSGHVKSIFELWQQQDDDIDLTLADLQTTVPEALALVGEEVWREKFPLKETGDGDPAADAPIPRRILGVMAKAVATVELDTVAANVMASAASTALSKVVVAARAWKKVPKITAKGTKKPLA